MAALALLSSVPAPAQAVPPPVYETVHCGDPAPVIDGILDEPCWERVEWAGGFVQWQPSEGEPPSQETEFKVLHDDHALYFGIRAHDTDPQAIVDRLARRDRFPGDWVEVNIDSYGDDRTAFSFTASASGTRGDEFISEDGDNWDGSWDPVWEFESHIDEGGWTAEIRIPLSQLRFAENSDEAWGLQVQRRVFRKEERSLWAPKSNDQTGWVSRFGELRGITDVGGIRQLELVPYTVAKGEFYPDVADDPFSDGTDGALALGLDGKLGVTSDLTMTFTVNPDFGQIEADPSQVNLSAFETFFEERRPFFVEGRNILDFQLAPAITGGPFTRDRLFYSRRVGSQPHGSAELLDDEFADTVEQTSILGAAKLTGKTRNGLSVGILESITAEESVDVQGPASARREIVEPLTNYFVGRVQQDLRGGDSQVGLIGTAVQRRTGDTDLDFLHRQAYAGGVDFRHTWSQRRWYVEGNGLASRVQGSAEAIENTQLSSMRYYQRPDNGAADLDPDRTSLEGWSSSLRAGLSKGEGVRFQVGMAARSPGFEINDAGFQRNANEINQFGWISYRRPRPFSIFRQAQINFNQWNDWDFDGEHLQARFNLNANGQLHNNWHLGTGVTRGLERVSNTQLRGGPSSRWPGSTAYQFWVNGDRRSAVTLDFGGYYEGQHDDSGYYREVWGGLGWQPSNALRLSFNPSFSQNRPDMQYVDTQSLGGDDRYLFGSFDQETMRLTVRVDYTLTPDLTLQFYGSPFLSSGSYDDLRRITDPRAGRYDDRYSSFDDQQIALVDDEYVVDENRDGSEDYRFDRPDFDVREFNSNLVLRWEYSAGSTLFLVWSQSRFGFDQRGRLDVGGDLDRLFAEEGRNVFLVKFSKWLSL